MGGGPLGAVPSNTKAPSMIFLEGDPPLGKERGALGVGTGPTLPPQNPSKPGGEASLLEELRRRRKMKMKIESEEDACKPSSSPARNNSSKKKTKKEQEEQERKDEAEAKKMKIKKWLNKKKEVKKTHAREKLATEEVVEETVEIVGPVVVDREEVETVEDTKKTETHQKPPKKQGFRAVLQMFNKEVTQENSFETWKKEKEQEKISRKRKKEQVDSEEGKEMDMTEKKSRQLSSREKGLRFKINDNNTPCYSKEADHQGGGVQGVSLEGGGVQCSDTIAATAVQRAGVGIGKYFLPVKMAAAAVLDDNTTGGK